MTPTRQVRDYFCHAMQQVENRIGDHTFHELFDTWLNEELAKAWEVGHFSVCSDVDYICERFHPNPYRKDEE